MRPLSVENLFAILGCLMLGGACSPDPQEKVTVVEFEAADRICIEGSQFLLRTREDAYQARRAFARSWNFYFAHIDRTDFRYIWLFVNDFVPTNNAAGQLFDSSFVSPSFGILTQKGKKIPFRIGTRWCDFDRNRQGGGCLNQRVFTLDPADLRQDRRSLAEMTVDNVKNTYLEFWCHRGVFDPCRPVTGAEILTALERYSSLAPCGSDIYLVPFSSLEDLGRDKKKEGRVMNKFDRGSSAN